jgi:hypothetical protein
MLSNGIRSRKAVLVAVCALLFGAGAVVNAALTTQARANDPDRGENRDAEVKETPSTNPQGTAGTPAIRAQRDAFWAQFTARREEYLAGKITPDLLLEADRFLCQADRECAATPWECVAASRASLRRVEEIYTVSLKKRAARQIAQADLSQAEGSLAEIKAILRADKDEAARKAAKDP